MDYIDELLSIGLRSKQLIFSHETALFLHGISDRMPFEHSVTVPSDKVPSKAIQRDCKIYYIKPELFELGKKKDSVSAFLLLHCHLPFLMPLTLIFYYCSQINSLSGIGQGGITSFFINHKSPY